MRHEVSDGFRIGGSRELSETAGGFLRNVLELGHHGLHVVGHSSKNRIWGKRLDGWKEKGEAAQEYTDPGRERMEGGRPAIGAGLCWASLSRRSRSRVQMYFRPASRTAEQGFPDTNPWSGQQQFKGRGDRKTGTLVDVECDRVRAIQETIQEHDAQVVAECTDQGAPRTLSWMLAQLHRNGGRQLEEPSDRSTDELGRKVTGVGKGKSGDGRKTHRTSDVAAEIDSDLHRGCFEQETVPPNRG